MRGIKHYIHGDYRGTIVAFPQLFFIARLFIKLADIESNDNVSMEYFAIW